MRDASFSEAYFFLKWPRPLIPLGGVSTLFRDFKTLRRTEIGGCKVDGNLLRQHYDDLKRRIDALNVEQKSTCLNYIKSTFGAVNEGYELASSADRERILKELRDVSRQLWSAGNRPQALALGVILLNIESRFTTDDDAAFVNAGTDTLIKETQTKHS